MVTIEIKFGPQNPLGIKSPQFLEWNFAPQATVRGEILFCSLYGYMGIKSCVLKNLIQEKNPFSKIPTVSKVINK